MALPVIKTERVTVKMLENFMEDGLVKFIDKFGNVQILEAYVVLNNGRMCTASEDDTFNLNTLYITTSGQLHQSSYDYGIMWGGLCKAVVDKWNNDSRYIKIVDYGLFNKPVGVTDMFKKVHNNACIVVPGSDGDIYAGTFTNRDGTTKYQYVISFKPGTKGIKHEVESFSLCQLYAGQLLPIVSDSCVGNEVLRELLRGF